MPLSNEQEIALQKFREGKNLVITGPGGTGKSELIKHLVSQSLSLGKKIQVTALTGCAALLIGSSAKTIHSWSGIKLAKGSNVEIIEKALKNRKVKKGWKNTDILIIDEASMMSKKIYELLDTLGQQMRGKIGLPFGGIQMILVGDFYQLPPIFSDGDADTGKFCFESENYYNAFPHNQHIVLKTIFRQNDPVYIKILNEVRVGELTESSIETLNQYIDRTYDVEKHNGVSLTKLFPTRNKVDTTNHNMFERIKEEPKKYKAVCIQDALVYAESGKAIEPDKMEICKKLSQYDLDFETEQFINNSPVIDNLLLKKGATIMCTANIKMDAGICNGSQGVIIDFVGPELQPKVKFGNGYICLMERHIWQHDSYPVICVKQYPLMLAWALTIHKIQGTTLNNAQMDVGSDIFAYGQSYVALSRIKSLDGLYLSSFVPSKVKADPKVKTFYEQLPDIVYDINSNTIDDNMDDIYNDKTNDKKKINIFLDFGLQSEPVYNENNETNKKIYMGNMLQKTKQIL